MSAARAVLPSTQREKGYLVHTAGAAGLLAAVDSPILSYKAACIKLAETLAIAHGDDGIQCRFVSSGVNTAVAPRQLGDGGTDGIVEADFVADKSHKRCVTKSSNFVSPEVQTYRTQSIGS